MIICPIHESNDCHNPAGAGGGQFCSSGTATCPGCRAPLRPVWNDASHVGCVNCDEAWPKDAVPTTMAPKPAPPKKVVDPSMKELVHYGGKVMQRRYVVRDLKRNKYPQDFIDRTLLGLRKA